MNLIVTYKCHMFEAVFVKKSLVKKIIGKDADEIVIINVYFWTLWKYFAFLCKIMNCTAGLIIHPLLYNCS